MSPLRRVTSSQASSGCHVLLLTLTAIIFYILWSSYSTASDDIFGGTIAKNDPLVLSYILENHLFPPSNEPYAFDKGEVFVADQGADTNVLKMVENKTNGFFVECGANDGEFLTNTFALEYRLHWDGLLVESSPPLFQKLKSRNRKAWISDTCLSGKIEKMEFLKYRKLDADWMGAIGKINPENKYKEPMNYKGFGFIRKDYESEGTVECFPLASILEAINVKTVDFFSLDVEGHEYQILSGIDFDKIDIRLLLVEHAFTPEGKQAIEDLMIGHGFKKILETEKDFIFKKM